MDALIASPKMMSHIAEIVEIAGIYVSLTQLIFIFRNIVLESPIRPSTI